jgi:hypothetical protein
MPSTLLRWILICMFWLLSSAAHAEGNCPPGQYPVGTPEGQIGPQVCAPIPGYNQQQAPPPPPERWLDQWGAISISPVEGTLGVSTQQRTEYEAQQAALVSCRTGGGSACTIESTYRNSCVALIVGHPGYAIAIGVPENDAGHKAMKVCIDGGNTNCHAYYSGCSLPIRIQ